MMTTIPAEFLDSPWLFLDRTVHELSIAMKIVELACEHVAACPDAKVDSIHIAIGAMTQVHESSLRFGFEVASEGTLLEGSRLVVRVAPIAVYCDACQCESQSLSLYDLHCPKCMSHDIEMRSGHELELEFLSLHPSSGVIE